MTKGLYSRSSDIYALGVLAWEILHEREAFEGMNEFSLINAIVNEDFRLQFEEATPAEVGTVLGRCMCLCPEERPQVREVCEVLHRALKVKKA